MRARGSGTVFQRRDGRWCAATDLGIQNGRRVRRFVYGWSEDEVTARLASMPEPRQQRPSGNKCEGCGRIFHPDDLFRHRCAGCFPWGGMTGLGVRHPARPSVFRSFVCSGCELVTWSRLTSELCFGCERATRQDWRVREERMAAARAVGSHTTAEWVALCDAHGGRCAYCGVVDKLTKDHVVPVVRGGSDLIENIAPACWDCNKRKGPRSVAEFRAAVAR